MHNIFGNRQVGMTNHAVGLHDTGQTAKGQRTQHKIRRMLSKPADSAGDLQKTADASGQKIDLCEPGQEAG